MLIQIKFGLLLYEAVSTTINVQVGGGGLCKGSFACENSMCAEGMGCGLFGCFREPGRPGVSWGISTRPVVCSRMRQLECWKRIGNGGYNIAVDMDEWSFAGWMDGGGRPWGILDRHGFTSVQEIIVEAVGELLHAGHAETR